MSGDANLGPWELTPEEWPSRNEKAKSVAAQYYLQEPKIPSPINSVEETDELIKVELNKSVPVELIAAMAFNSGKTVVANVNEDVITTMEDNTVNLEEQTAPIQETTLNQESMYEETSQVMVIETEEEQLNTFVRFWRFMNKPIYVRTWFGFPAPRS